MFGLFRRKKIMKYVDGAAAYVLQNYEAPEQPTEIKYSLNVDSYLSEESEIQYSGHEEPDDRQYEIRDKKKEDPYDAAEVTRVLRKSSEANDFAEMFKTLERNLNQSFVDRLLYYINERGVRDSEVYKAAQMDKRLFSKIVSNRDYKPSKDSAIALALALELSLDEANDMLSRAGYTFSHSNKRDIIIEYFFREKVYNLIDANDVLHRLNQKLIGRS